MSKRTVIKRDGKSIYAERDAEGKFTDITNIGKSIQADEKNKSAKKVAPGHGHEGDVEKPKKNPIAKAVSKLKK